MYKMSIIGNLTLDWTGQYKKGEEKFTLGRKVRNIVLSKNFFFVKISWRITCICGMGM